MKQQIEKIRADFKHGGKLGPKSTEHVLVLLEEIVQRIEKLERISGALMARIAQSPMR